jgi:HK97 family phage prohead protease
MPDRMIVPVEWKAAAPGGPGELEGHASVFGNIDQDGDVVLPGAFKKTLSDWSRSKQPLPLIADHDLSTAGVIGSVHDAREDDIGLRVKARFSSDAKAQSIRTKMVEGHLKGMSFTYEPLKHFRGPFAGKSARFLQELRLFEVTVSPFPINELATASAKAGDPKKPYGDVTYADPGYQSDGKKRYPLDTEEHIRAAWSYINQSGNAGKYTSEQAALIKGRIRAAMKRIGATVSEAASMDFTRWAGNMRKALDIDDELSSKAAVAVLLPQYHDDAAGPADEPESTADAAASTPDDGAAGTAESKDAAAYAASFLTPPGPPDGAPAGELAYPQQLLESLKDEAAFGALEAQINQALGRAAT